MNIELTDMVFPFQVIESRKLDRAVTGQQATPTRHAVDEDDDEESNRRSPSTLATALLVRSNRRRHFIVIVMRSRFN